MRIVSWNIRAGGGTRIDGIAAQIERWAPDLVSLCEFRATPPSSQLAALLAEQGYEHQLTTAHASAPGRNALLVASRYPLRRLLLRRRPVEPARFLSLRVDAEVPFVLGAMHIPNFVTGRKFVYLDAVTALGTRWRHGPAMFLGDTNCGWPGLDEERPVFNAATALWLDGLAALGWRDAYRLLDAEGRFYTWYSPNGGNGFRLDQAFLNRRMQTRLQRAWYEWGAPSQSDDTLYRRDALSDHAALLLDLA
jgi:exonuclease III